MNETNKNGITINVNLNDSRKEVKKNLFEDLKTDKLLTKEEIERELERGTMVKLDNNNGGVIHARLICTPGNGKYYSDTRENGKLKIGKEIAKPYYIG